MQFRYECLADRFEKSTLCFQMERELNLSPRAKPRYSTKVRLCVARYK